MKTRGKTVKALAVLVVIALLLGFIHQYNLGGNDDKRNVSTSSFRLMPGEFAFVRIDDGSASPMPDPHPPFSREVLEAVERTPGWLRYDLERKFNDLSLIAIDVPDGASPYLRDLDLDDDPDLAVGNGAGEVRYWKNEGSSYRPIFTVVDLMDDIDCSGNAAPAIADLTGDGITDVVLGRDDGTLVHYRNDGSNEEPVWAEDEEMFSDIDVGENARPVFIDYDDDGDPDLVVTGHTTVDTQILYYENAGTAEEPSWERHLEVFALLEFEIMGYPFHALADLDTDGDLDLTLGGLDGRLRHFENAGSIYATLWVEDVTLFTDIDVGWDAVPSAADLNGDGLIDLIVGSGDGCIYNFPNVGTPESPRFVSLCTGSIYCSGSMGEIAGDVIHEARSQVLGPATINVDRMLKEYYRDDVETYAGIINAAPSNCVDELAFIVSNSAISMLRAMTGTIDLDDPEVEYDPDILLDHVEEHYELDGELEYAGIVEKTDWTTLWYIDGEGDRRELPRDVYYWYVVHPRCRYEAPGYTHDDHWREYLRHDDSTGTTLVDAVRDAGNVHEAAQLLTNWMDSFMEFGYDTHDKTPIEIYDARYGSCGEYSILTNALGRAVFIPTRLANDWGEDHVWNEFYDDIPNGTWHHWDTTTPVIDDPEMYERDWGKDISCVWSIRGDDFPYDISEKYTATGHLTINVKDRNGIPVDGACVVMESEYFVRNSPQYWQVPTIAFWNYTDLNGRCEFDLGGNYYTIDVMSEIGNFHRGYPDMDEWSPTGSYHLFEGTEDVLDVTMDGEMPRGGSRNERSRPGDRTKLSFHVDEVSVVAQSIISYPDDTVVITRDRYPQEIEGSLRVFACDEPNFHKYLKGLDFDCIRSIQVSESASFDLPGGEWYVVLCNRYCLGTAFEIEVKAS